MQQKLLTIFILTGALAMSACQSDWKKTPLVDFDHLTLPTSPNYCLACPHCNSAQKHQIQSPEFNYPVSTLKKHWQAMIDQQPRVTLLQSQGDHWQYVQRSAMFRFPDIIDVKFTALEAQRSTVSIFSRSVYGYGDLGVNCKRVRSWLNVLKKQG